MQTNLANLAVVTMCLPDIQRTLGEERWTVFTTRLRGHAAAFQNLARQADLTRAVDELMSFLHEDKQISKLITETNVEHIDISRLFGDRLHPSNSQPPPLTIPLDTVTLANGFFLLCEHPELVAAGVTLDELAAEGAQGAAKPDQTNAATISLANRADRLQVKSKGFALFYPLHKLFKPLKSRFKRSADSYDP